MRTETRLTAPDVQPASDDAMKQTLKHCARMAMFRLAMGGALSFTFSLLVYAFVSPSRDYRVISCRIGEKSVPVAKFDGSSIRVLEAHKSLVPRSTTEVLRMPWWSEVTNDSLGAAGGFREVGYGFPLTQLSRLQLFNQSPRPSPSSVYRVRRQAVTMVFDFVNAVRSTLGMSRWRPQDDPPNRIIWTGTAANSLFWGVVLGLSSALFQTWRKRSRRLRNRCVSCGYSLTVKSAVCPECGSSIA